MSILQRVERVESFLQKLKALADINENHLNDQILLLELETIDTVTFGRETLVEEVVAAMVANALTRLHRSQPTVEVVKKLIDMFPTSLDRTKEGTNLIPLQHAVNNLRYYAKYMHLFVRASCTGYLLYGSSVITNQNILQILASTNIEDEIPCASTAVPLDRSLADTIEHFCKQGFITEEDIENHGLLALSCEKRCMRRFGCLTRWNKEALKTSRVGDKPLLHYLFSEKDFDSIEIFLQVSFQLFPDESGLLFYGDYSEQDHVQMYQAVLEQHFDSFHKTLEKVLRPISFPLLHQICKRSDGRQLLHAFTFLPQVDVIPPACRLLMKSLDKDGRSYHQALFAYCPEQLISIPFGGRPEVNNVSVVELVTKDPVTGLLPFMAVATNGSVECIYRLLLKHPAVLLNCIESSGVQKSEPMTLKRKRDNTN